MLSKIGGFISPLLSKGDAVERPDERQEREKGDGKKQDEPAPEAQGDDTYFSLEAIRALLLQENVDAQSDVMACLDLLRQHGIASIPIRNEQPIFEAIMTAAAPLKGK